MRVLTSIALMTLVMSVTTTTTVEALPVDNNGKGITTLSEGKLPPINERLTWVPRHQYEKTDYLNVLPRDNREGPLASLNSQDGANFQRSKRGLNAEEGVIGTVNHVRSPGQDDVTGSDESPIETFRHPNSTRQLTDILNRETISDKLFTKRKTVNEAIEVPAIERDDQAESLKNNLEARFRKWWFPVGKDKEEGKSQSR
ncbi:unnamed protein product [Sympodiomycopsis kandeliae]